MAGRQFAQRALAFSVFAGEFGNRLFCASVRFVQKGGPQLGAAGFEACFGFTYTRQRFFNDALTLTAGAINHRLRTSFGFQQALQLVVHCSDPEDHRQAAGGDTKACRLHCMTADQPAGDACAMQENRRQHEAQGIQRRRCGLRHFQSVGIAVE